MARDRKRAKARQQRQQRRPGQPGGTASRARPEADEAPELGDALDALNEDESTLEAPEPLEHASGDAEIAEAQIASGRASSADAPDDTAEDDARLAASQADDEELGTSRVPAARSREDGSRVGNFLRGSWRELQRVQWPDRRQVAQGTAVVLGFVVIAGAFLGLMDALFARLVDAII